MSFGKQTFDFGVKRMAAWQKVQFLEEISSQEYVTLIDGTLKVELAYHGYIATARGYFKDEYGEDTEDVCDVHFEAARCRECGSITWTWGEGGECVCCPNDLCDNSDTA